MAGHANDEVDMKKRKKAIELAAHPLPMRKKKNKMD